MRKRIYHLVHVSHGAGARSLDDLYDYFMMFVILASLVPLAFRGNYLGFQVMEMVIMAIFAIDYLLRWATADFKYGKKSVTSFLRYPFSPMAIFDLLIILSFVTMLDNGIRALNILRVILVFQTVKAFRYSRSVGLIGRVLKKSKDGLFVVVIFTVAYIATTALFMFNVEPGTFHSFFDSLYWAVITLATIGYGDIVPKTDVGKVVTILSSIVGLVVLALPVGIISAAFTNEIQIERERKEKAEQAHIEEKEKEESKEIKKIEKKIEKIKKSS